MFDPMHILGIMFLTLLNNQKWCKIKNKSQKVIFLEICPKGSCQIKVRLGIVDLSSVRPV